MTVWIMLSTLTIGATTLDVSPEGNKYVMATKELCEYAIAESKMLKCVEFKLVGAAKWESLK